MESLFDVLLLLGSVNLLLYEFSVFSLGVLLSFSSNSFGVLSDFSVDLGVQGFNGGNLGVLQVLFPKAELSGQVISLQALSVVIDVDTEDSFSVDLGVVFIRFTFFFGFGETGESLFRVGNPDSAISSSLEGTENSVTGGGSNETSIEDGLEGSSFFVDLFFTDVVAGGIDLFVTLVEGIHLQLFKQSSGDQETGGVGRSVVSKTGGESPSS